MKSDEKEQEKEEECKELNNESPTNVNLKPRCNTETPFFPSNSNLSSSYSFQNMTEGTLLNLQVPPSAQLLEVQDRAFQSLAKHEFNAGSSASSRKREHSLEKSFCSKPETSSKRVAASLASERMSVKDATVSSEEVTLQPPAQPCSVTEKPSLVSAHSISANSERNVFAQYVESLPDLEKRATQEAQVLRLSAEPTASQTNTICLPESPSSARASLQRRLLELSGTEVANIQQTERKPAQESKPDWDRIAQYFSAMKVDIMVPKFTGLCGTALCYVMNPVTGNMIQIRALLDSGANLTMLNREVAKALGLTGKKVAINLNVAGGGSIVCNETEVVFRLVKRDKSHVTKPIVGMTTESVGNPFSPVDFRPRKHEHLKDVELADKFPAPNERPFQLLLSEPYFSLLEKMERRIPQDPALPMAVSTELGWVLRGATGIQEQVKQASSYGVLAQEHETFDLGTMYRSIGFDFAKFWSGENVGIQANESMTSELTALEIQAEEFQKQTAKYDEEKRQWSVQLPWINQDQEARVMTDNTSRAVAMWHKVLHSVKEEHMSLVEDAYEELLVHGFAEKVPDHEVFPDHPTYVMTSRPVFRFDKATTKCRIVINASLPDQRDPSKSLNKLLMPGPNKLPQIMMLVLRTMMREHLVLIDVKKMFLAIRLEKLSDKDMLRFVWAKPGSDRPDLLRYRVLAFGVVSSPFQAIWCLHETAKMFLKKYPISAQIILDMTYMDDINITANSVVEAKKRTMEVLEILNHGGFYGHKISASNPEIVNELEKERLDQARTISVLGLKLNHDTCEFMFDLDEKFDQFDAKAEKITRTDVVSLASKIFDTQGFVSPYIMQYKKILPMLWQNKTTWTENLKTKTVTNENGQQVPDEVATEAVDRFCEWIQDVPRLKELKFPRYIMEELDFVAIFGDASKTGIGVVAYAVSKLETGKLHSQIIYSKSTLMPKNLREKAMAEDALTIARAELIAMLSCVTMSDYLLKALDPILTRDKIHIFTDSLLNLQRIQRGKGKCKPWEERRVCKILDGKGESTIAFCPGIINPSDLPSRGCTMDELIERLDFWKYGPDFLRLPKSEWPKQPSPSEKSLDETGDSVMEDSGVEISLYFAQLQALRKEASAQATHVMAAQEDPVHDPVGLGRLLKDCSSLQTIRGVITRCKRLANKARKLPMSLSPLTTKEVEFADNLLAQHAQKQHLAKEIELLKQEKQVQKGSILKDLPVYYDKEDQLVRLKSRLHMASSLNFDYANPILMPKSILAEKLALEVHTRRFHCSQKATFDTLRQTYWFCGGFRYVKDIVRKQCKTPRCRYIKYCSPKMSPLPDIRIDHPDPWRNVGVDYLGPLHCSHVCPQPDPSKCLHLPKFKVWLAVFTCLHTRAIHVEVVQSCSTMDFLMAFRSFVARKGRPLVFYSDQAKTFKAADKQLRQLLSENMSPVYDEHFGASCPIEWKFSTETAPWANGCTERLVGIFKKQLKVMVQKHTLTLKQLETLVLEVTQSVNDRPLGVTREGSEDSQITPNLLQFGRHPNPLRTPSTAKMSTMQCSDMWIQRKKILAHFWSRWQSDYLSTLSIDRKWLHDDHTMIKPGDVVILKPETLEKGQWRLARVMDVHKNLDGVVTTASVRLPSGVIFSRTLRQIALLETSYERLETTQAVTEESTMPSTCPKRDVRSGKGFDESTRTPPAKGYEDRSRPEPSPCPIGMEQSIESDYPGEAVAATPDPGSLLPADQEIRDGDDQGQRRSKRARQRKGFYKQLNEGTL